MADTTELAVDASGFDRLLTTISATTEESKKLGETMKKALLGEVLVSSLNRISSGLKDGVAKEAVGAASALVQGFAQGGPVGAAMAGAAVAVGLVTKGVEALANAEREVQAVRAAGYKARADFERGVAAQQEVFAELNRERTSAQAAALVAEDEKRAAAAKARREQNERDAIESTTRQIEAEAGQRRVAEEVEAEQFSRFLRETDATIIRDAETKARTAIAAQARVFREEERKRESVQFAADADALTAGLLDDLVAKADEANRQIGGTLGVGIGDATAALVAMDAAQIQAAASAGTLAGSLAEAAARGVSAELQAIAQRETVLALADGAAAIGRLAFGDVQGAGFLGTSSAQHAAAAVAAGAGAVALNTVATAAAPAVPQQPTAVQQRGGGAGGSSGGVTINVSTDRLFSTEADIGASVEYSRKQFARYRGY